MNQKKTQQKEANQEKKVDHSDVVSKGQAQRHILLLKYQFTMKDIEAKITFEVNIKLLV